jgi:6-phosphogluconolactonase (cycloisomerase 2 family)
MQQVCATSSRLPHILLAVLATVILLAVVGCSSSYSPPPPPPPPTGKVNFVYTANAAGSPSTVSALSSNQTSGVLSAISGSPYDTNSQSRAVKADSAGKFLYVANSGSGDISAFTINVTTGALSAVAGSPFSVEPGVVGIAIDPAGTYLYAVSGSSSNNLWEFSIDSAGALHNLTNSPLPIDATVTASGAITIDPSGKYLYTTSDSASGTNIYAFTLDAGTGEASSIAGAVYPIDLFSNSIITDPAGKFVIAVSNGSSTSFGLIAVFSLNSTTGELTAAGTPFHTGSDPSSLTTDPSGKFVYVADTADATISAFTLDSTSGALSVVTGSPFPSGGQGMNHGPLGIAADAGGKYIYVCNASNDISVFTFSAQTGVLTALAGSPFPSGGSGPTGIAVVQKK